MFKNIGMQNQINKPVLKIINPLVISSFYLLNVHEAYFFPAWHFHPEYEITLVLDGTGLRFVGDNLGRFGPGDVLLYGGNIPHLHRSDGTYNNSILSSKAIVIYFSENILGQGFWELSDSIYIKKLLSYSKRGIIFEGRSSKELAKQIIKINNEKDDIGRIINLLIILKMMSESKDYNLLSSISYEEFTHKDNCERMNKVYQFMLENYARNPSLEETSDIANMCVTAFCRYFKIQTNKTYTEFLNEIKIGNACKLLINNNQIISQICFEVGFNSFSHFNNQFKKRTGLCPYQYRLKYSQNIMNFSKSS